MATDNYQQAHAWMHRRFGATLAGKATDAFCVRATATEPPRRRPVWKPFPTSQPRHGAAGSPMP